MMAAPVAAVIGLAAANPVECQAQRIVKSINLKGKIGGKYSFTMHLNQYSDKTINGTYFYGNGKNGSLGIAGYREDNGKIVLMEYNDKSEMTGYWNIVIRKQNGKFVMSGNMINYKGTKYPLTGYQF